MPEPQNQSELRSFLGMVHLYMYSLSGMILLYLAMLYYNEGVFAWDIITFARLLQATS